jgi:hypothetical protein
LVELGGTAALRGMTARGAERKFLFDVSCFRFCPFSVIARAVIQRASAGTRCCDLKHVRRDALEKLLGLTARRSIAQKHVEPDCRTRYDFEG